MQETHIWCRSTQCMSCLSPFILWLILDAIVSTEAPICNCSYINRLLQNNRNTQNCIMPLSIKLTPLSLSPFETFSLFTKASVRPLFNPGRVSRSQVGWFMATHFDWPQSQFQPVSLRQSEKQINESWGSQPNSVLHWDKSYPSFTQVYTLDLAQAAL